MISGQNGILIVLRSSYLATTSLQSGNQQDQNAHDAKKVKSLYFSPISQHVLCKTMLDVIFFSQS